MTCPNCDSLDENIYNVEYEGTFYYFCTDCNEAFIIEYASPEVKEHLIEAFRED